MAQPGDYWDADDESFVGTLARVVRVSPNSEVVYAAYPNGVISRLVASGPTNFSAGDVVLIGDSRWVAVDPELWTEPRGIGVVRKVLDDQLLVEAPGSLLLTDRSGSIAVEPGNTILYSVQEGASEVIDQHPLRIRDGDQPVDDDDPSRFEYKSAEPLTYADFGGYATVVARARHIIETQFQRKDRLEAIGARPVRGILFSGNPGTGKTYLGRVIASESDAAFFLVSGPAVVSKFVGDTEQSLRRIFDEAQSRDRAIIFFDEIDSIASERNEDSHEASNRLVAQLLTEMDGFSQTRGNVIVLAATNRPDSIDPALRRPGRFDWEIKFGLPTVEERLAILEVDSRRLATRAPLPLENLAADTNGWSGAELASIWTEAALIAARDARSAIDGEDLLEAFEIVKLVMRDKTT